VVHQLGLQGITWDDFISREFLRASQEALEVKHEIGEPSHQYERLETVSVPVFIKYQRGTRHLFAAAKRVLSPPRVEGASLPPSAEQVQDRGKSSLQEEGPSGERETDFILIQDDDTDMGSQSANLRDIIQE